VTFATRADRKGPLTVKPRGRRRSGRRKRPRCGFGHRQKAQGSASGLLATSGTKPLKLVISLKRKDLALLKRKRKLRVNSDGDADGRRRQTPPGARRPSRFV